MLGVISPHFVLVRLIFSLICIGNILCVSIVVVKIGVVENQLLPPPMKMKEVVFTLFCLFVCLCTGYLKKLWTNPDEILWTGLVYDKDEMARFW